MRRMVLVVAPIAMAALLGDAGLLGGQEVWAQPGGMGMGGGWGGMAGSFGQPLPSADLPAGVLTVKVIGEGMQDLKVGQSVELHREKDGRFEKVETLVTGSDGRARFSGLVAGQRVLAVVPREGARVESSAFVVPSAGGVRLLLPIGEASAAAHGSAPAGSDAAGASPGGAMPEGHPGQGASLPPGEVTSEAQALRVSAGSHIIARLAEDRVSFMQVWIVDNASGKIYDPKGQGVVFPLPEKAENGAVLEGSSAFAEIDGDKRGVRLKAPLGPGRLTLQISYEIPFDTSLGTSLGGGAALDFRQAVPLASEALIFASDTNLGLSVHGPSVAEERASEHEGSEMRLVTLKPAEAGGFLDFTIENLPRRDLRPRVAALVLAGLIALWALGSALSGRARRASHDRERLLGELVQLERKQKGSAGADSASTDGGLAEKDYRRERKRLFEQLRQLWET